MMSMDENFKISVIIPTFNPEEKFNGLISSLLSQTRKPDEIIILDSESDNDVFAELPVGQVDFEVVSRRDFDHGRTRDYGFRKAIGDIVIFMTQDALPYNDQLIELLVRYFENENVAAVMARQVAYPDAYIYERFVREYSYPDVDRVTTPENMNEYGIDAYKLSDVCAAYRRKAYFEVGGFDYPILTNEDMLMAQKLLDSGYSIVYSSEAKVFHSHNLSLKQQYVRNYKIGYTLERFSERFRNIEESGRGASLAFSVGCRLLLHFHFISFVRFFADCVARYTGNRKGHKTYKKEH